MEMGQMGCAEMEIEHREATDRPGTEIAGDVDLTTGGIDAKNDVRV